MTVKELIEKLKEYPEKTPVVLKSKKSDFHPDDFEEVDLDDLAIVEVKPILGVPESKQIYDGHASAVSSLFEEEKTTVLSLSGMSSYGRMKNEA